MEIEDWEKRSEDTPLKVHMIGNNCINFNSRLLGWFNRTCIYVTFG